MTSSKGPVPIHGGSAAMPFDQFAKMFPMNLPPGGNAHVKVIHIKPGASDAEVANLIGDHLINSILSELSGGFQDGMLPLMHHAQASTRSAEPHPCEEDLKKFCHEDHDHDHHHESDIHCLGLHANEISEKCAEEIRHSLPFLCSMEISVTCSVHNTMDKSVLQCLEDAMEKDAEESSKKQLHFSQFSDECKNAVVATRSVVNKMKIQNVALVDRKTGEVIRSTAAFVSRSIEVGVILAVVGVVALILFAVWTRDDETSIIKSIQRTFRSIKGSIFGSSGPNDQHPSRTQVMEMKGSSGFTL